MALYHAPVITLTLSPRINTQLSMACSHDAEHRVVNGRVTASVCSYGLSAEL